MITTSEEGKWSIGEIVILPSSETLIKKSGVKSYKRIVGSHYVCVRETGNGQRGILVKVLGKYSRDQISFVGGEPFCKDIIDELFEGKCYVGYPFPSEEELKEVLDVIRKSPELVARFEKAQMHLNPASIFWVRESSRNRLLKRQLRFYDATTDQLYTSTDDDKHYRLSIAYF